MFGAVALYAGGRMFGLVHDDRLYLKVDDRSRADYLAAGSEAFRPNERMTSSTLYEVPSGVLDSREELLAWAQTARAVAG